ncbi:hypothetical protein [Myroides odoratus]|uniref:hypothetical protein n=1 Tax=Myroides odoratus TaxID=256 RepID=UPI0039B0C257
MQQKHIECTKHGQQEMALLCTHLAHSLLNRISIGFHKYDSGDTGRPDAWCNTCEEAWSQTKTEADREQWFMDCQHKIVCVSCWDEAKELNKDTSKIAFKVLDLEEIKAIILADCSTKQSFPPTITFSFPPLYEELVTRIQTLELSSETFLFNAVEATLENNEKTFSTHWVFAGDGQGDRWLIDEENQIFFADHDQDPIPLQAMNINFVQWLQMAFVVQQLDDSLQADYPIEKIASAFNAVLNQIHPRLAENYPFEIL